MAHTRTTVAGFIHCGPNPPKPGPMPNGEMQLPLAEIYEGMAQFPMATLEKVKHTGLQFNATSLADFLENIGSSG